MPNGFEPKLADFGLALRKTSDEMSMEMVVDLQEGHYCTCCQRALFFNNNKYSAKQF